MYPTYLSVEWCIMGKGVFVILSTKQAILGICYSDRNPMQQHNQSN